MEYVNGQRFLRGYPSGTVCPKCLQRCYRVLCLDGQVRLVTSYTGKLVCHGLRTY
jgi:hypothetical protein